MPFCPKCGTQITPGFSFCPQCGFKVDSLSSGETFINSSMPAVSSEQVDFVEKYLSLDPGADTFDSFIANVTVKGDVVSICLALDSEIKPAILSGNPSAQVVLGVLHKKGFGVDNDQVKAIKCFMDAAEKGNPVAEWIAGLINMEADSSLAQMCDIEFTRGYQ